MEGDDIVLMVPKKALLATKESGIKNRKGRRRESEYVKNKRERNEARSSRKGGFHVSEECNQNLANTALALGSWSIVTILILNM